MTTERLRDLMEERVSDVEADDLSARAWARADGVRRRRRFAVVGTAAAAVLVLAGGVAVLDDRPSATNVPTDRPTSSLTPTTVPPEPASAAPRASFAGEFRGAPFWWAPPAEQDSRLPWLAVPGLPDQLSMADADPVTTPPDRVDAVFATGKQRYRLLSHDRLQSVDLSDRLGPVADSGGNALSPLTSDSLSQDGTRVLFVQPEGLEVWDLPTNTWESFPMSVEEAEQAAWSMDGHLGVEEYSGRPDPWDRGDHQGSSIVAGPVGEGAELDWMEGTGAPVTDGSQVANPDFLAVGTPAAPELLAFSTGRNKLCCPPMAWFSHDFLLFAASSSDGAYRVLAWRIGTPDLYRVSEYADIVRPGFVASWAEDAFR